MNSIDTAKADEVNPREHLREQAGVLKDDLKELGRTTKDAAKDTANRYLDQSKHKYGELEDQVVKYIREKPVKCILIAAGAGLLAGFLFSRR